MGKSDGIIRLPSARALTAASPIASPASQLRALRAGEATATSANTPAYPAARMVSSKAPPSSTPQLIESAVHAVRPAREAPASIASFGTGARGNSRSTSPRTTTHQTATTSTARASTEYEPSGKLVATVPRATATVTRCPLETTGRLSRRRPRRLRGRACVVTRFSL